MTYELALELKNAGFPQRMGCSVCLHGFSWDKGMSPDEMIRNDTWVHNPTLSELVEACGDDFRWLKARGHGENRQWLAQGRPHPIDYSKKEPRCMGFTPEEAVAKLWLALNENKI